MADVFISYAREDRARAEQVARGLEGAGLDVFWDSEIPPGQTWADYIEGKLSVCKAVIVLWSANSTKSQWVREEARMGRDRGTLIPAMIDTSQAPFGFGEVQAANLAAWNGDPNHVEWRRFMEAVRGAAGKSGPAPQPASRPAMSPPPPAGSSGWREPPAAARAPEPKKGFNPMWIVGGVVVAAVAIGGLFVIGAAFNSATSPPAPAPDPQQEAVVPTPAPMPADANSPQAIILSQLQQAEGILAQQGFQVVGQPVTGGLAQGENWNWPVTLEYGYEYRILGVCDRDCADLDLLLFNDAQQVIAQDTSTDDHPLLSVLPDRSGSGIIQVQMFNCTVAPCYYAIALYGKRAG